MVNEGSTSTPAAVPVVAYRNLDLVAPGLVSIPVYDRMTGAKTEEVLVPEDLSTEATAYLLRLMGMQQTGLDQAGLENLSAALLEVCKQNPAYAEWTTDDVKRRWPSVKTQLVIIRNFLQSLDLSGLS